MMCESKNKLYGLMGEPVGVDGGPAEYAGL